MRINLRRHTDTYHRTETHTHIHTHTLYNVFITFLPCGDFDKCTERSQSYATLRVFTRDYLKISTLRRTDRAGIANDLSREYTPRTRIEILETNRTVNKDGVSFDTHVIGVAPRKSARKILTTDKLRLPRGATCSGGRRVSLPRVHVAPLSARVSRALNTRVRSHVSYTTLAHTHTHSRTRASRLSMRVCSVLSFCPRLTELTRCTRIRHGRNGQLEEARGRVNEGERNWPQNRARDLITTERATRHDTCEGPRTTDRMGKWSWRVRDVEPLPLPLTLPPLLCSPHYATHRATTLPPEN